MRDVLVDVLPSHGIEDETMKRIHGAWYIKFNGRWYYCGRREQALNMFGKLRGLK